MLGIIKRGARALDGRMGLNDVGWRKTDMAFVKHKLIEIRRLVQTGELRKW